MQTIILIILLTITSSTFAQTYGPTKAGDLLWNIAGKVRPNESITRYQAMLALLKANPQAFQIPCNLNTLKVGKILQIPSNMQELTKKEAVNEFYRQRDEWKDFRKKQIICKSTQSILKIPIIKPTVESNSKITPTETFETIVPKQPIKHDVKPVVISQLSINNESDDEFETTIPKHNIKPVSQSSIESDEIESFALIQSTWYDVKTWFYSLAYIYQVLVLTLISISLLLLFALVFRNKKVIDKEKTINTEEALSIDSKQSELPKKSDKMRDKLDAVRAYLAEDEDNRIQKLLRDVMQNGTDEQRVEAQQLYEINKKMSYLKLADTQSINTNFNNIEQINKLIPDELPLAKDQVFDLIDKVFLMLDEELNAQGKLIDSYIARQQKVVNSNITNYENSYPIVEDENSLKRPDLKPTRKL
ncbi:MAG TPA: hypothetical protein ENK59_06495 [Thioploca sp.]|nr:hypothetical protein [Thioploca sp.]